MTDECLTDLRFVLSDTPSDSSSLVSVGRWRSWLLKGLRLLMMLSKRLLVVLGSRARIRLIGEALIPLLDEIDGFLVSGSLFVVIEGVIGNSSPCATCLIL